GRARRLQPALGARGCRLGQGRLRAQAEWSTKFEMRSPRYDPSGRAAGGQCCV
ncbi:MAG: hypothetical protein AVDCRST_MAG90-1830, partial [uncultured Microvirga sp.]